MIIRIVGETGIELIGAPGEHIKALRTYVENGTVILVGATTENPSFELNAALLSRCQVMVLRRLDEVARQLSAIVAYLHHLMMRRQRLHNRCSNCARSSDDNYFHKILSIHFLLTAWRCMAHAVTHRSFNDFLFHDLVAHLPHQRTIRCPVVYKRNNSH